MTSRGFFLTGTGTDVGKTYAAAYVVHLARLAGHHPLYYKPVQCGPVIQAGRTYPGGDAEYVQAELGVEHAEYGTLLKSPTSPHFAFNVEGRRWNPEPMRERLLHARRDFDFVVCEGAGGIRVPLDDRLDMGDMARDTLLPVLVAASPGLGTINHTLLTIEALETRRIPVAGFLFVHRPEDPPPQDTRVRDNANTITRREAAPFLGHIPPFSDHWLDNAEQHPLTDAIRKQFAG